MRQKSYVRFLNHNWIGLFKSIKENVEFKLELARQQSMKLAKELGSLFMKGDENNTYWVPAKWILREVADFNVLLKEVNNGRGGWEKNDLTCIEALKIVIRPSAWAGDERNATELLE